MVNLLALSFITFPDFLFVRRRLECPEKYGSRSDCRRTKRRRKSRSYRRLCHEDALVKEYYFSEDLAHLENGTEYIGIRMGETSPDVLYQQSTAPVEELSSESIYE